MFDEITYSDILEDCLSYVPDTVDKREGSIIYDAIAPCCYELYTMYQALSTAFDQSFPDTATGEYLERIAQTRGLTRYPATYAKMSISVTPSNIDMTGKVLAANGLLYTVTESAGAGLWYMTCNTAGTEGNAVPDRIYPNTTVSGLLEVEFQGFARYAEDEESDDALRKRYFDSITGAYFAGNPGDYINRVSVMDGVGGVRVVRASNGAGTVGIYITDADYGVPDESIVNVVQTSIDEFTPIGHTPTVYAANEMTVDFHMSIEFSPSGDNMYTRNAISATIEEYLSGIRHMFGQDNEEFVVRVSEIVARVIKINGVNDIYNVGINNTDDNLILDAGTLPVLGDVYINGVI